MVEKLQKLLFNKNEEKGLHILFLNDFHQSDSGNLLIFAPNVDVFLGCILQHIQQFKRIENVEL